MAGSPGGFDSWHNRDVTGEAPILGPTYIRAWRIHRGLSLEQAATRALLSKGSLSQIERGRLPYTQRTLERLADVLACSPSELIDRHPEEAEALWRVVRGLGPADRRRLTIIAESLARSGWDEPEDSERDAPGRNAARAIGADGLPREPSEG